jgi:hypothetical protein
MVGGEHYCRPCSQVYLYAKPLMVDVNTPKGRIVAMVKAELVLLDEHVAHDGHALSGTGHQHEHGGDDHDAGMLMPSPRIDSNLVGQTALPR